jgi:transcription antitermination factor NusG
MMAAPLRWYVLRVRLGFETLVASELRKRNLTVFVPFRRNDNCSDRTPFELSRMAFPGYVFVRFSIDDWLAIGMIPGVLLVAGVPQPMPVSETTMSDLKAAFNAELQLKILAIKHYKQPGRISSGPLRGRIGMFIQSSNSWHLAIAVEALERTLAFALPDESVDIGFVERKLS